MRERFDVVVAGAGHNSLVAAAYLARAGLRCLVLEARPEIGGNTSVEEGPLPGFWQDACATAHSIFQTSPIWRDDELRLADYGLEYLRPEPAAHVALGDGSWFTQWTDLDRTCEELARFCKRDADAYRRMLREYESVAPLVSRHRYTPIGFGPSLDERLAAHPEGFRWRRRLAMSSWELIRDTFRDWHNRAFMLWMATQTVQPADRPGTGQLAYSIVYGRQRHSWAIPKGGSAALPRALARIVEEHGGVVRTGTPVTGLVLERGRCTGVETAGGERYLARKAVLSSIHVKHLVQMAPRETWGEEFWYGVETWQPGVTLFASYYATTRAPAFEVEGGTVAPVASGVAPSVERLLRIGDDFRRSHVDTHDPVLLVLCPTTADPSRAPAGRHTLKIV